eukprot:CAMPEP_0175139826 /NCGR_PEP_ID=MMETSP0087-20121206/11130_1 /TAXON_ID=136419 /ORGANISM="Unknown Unknown, Strain D1" /LENGTH=451 /DNA_ID=CAMNT_0016422903 /DNA_START=19 /DNA_END=1374 /DNA_ORIENTATION=+
MEVVHADEAVASPAADAEENSNPTRIHGHKFQGVCKFWNAVKGYGFITGNDGFGDLFVSQHDLVTGDSRFRALVAGQAVECVYTEDGEKKIGKEVRAAGGGFLPSFKDQYTAKKAIEKAKPEDPNKLYGTVKWFNTFKNYGFIIPTKGGGDIYFHGSECMRNIIPQEGDLVEYSIKENEDKQVAIAVKNKSRRFSKPEHVPPHMMSQHLMNSQHMPMQQYMGSPHGGVHPQHSHMGMYQPYPQHQHSQSPQHPSHLQQQQQQQGSPSQHQYHAMNHYVQPHSAPYSGYGQSGGNNSASSSFSPYSMQQGNRLQQQQQQQNRNSAARGPVKIGMVKFFDSRRGYGFIIPEFHTGYDLHVHQSNVIGSITKDDCVQYQEKLHLGKLQAINVQKFDRPAPGGANAAVAGAVGGSSSATALYRSFETSMMGKQADEYMAYASDPAAANAASMMQI